MNTQPQMPVVGTIVNGCKIIAEIGAGGMGSVFKAYDETLSRHVAIKIMHQATNEKTGKIRFLREASAIARLDHPGIVKIYSYGEYNGQPFFIMEFVAGWSIRDFIGRCRFIHNAGHSINDLQFAGYLKESQPGTPYFLQDHLINPLSDPDYPEKVRKLLFSAASALAAAHQQGIIHRDIKSSNILISDDARLKIVDFGLVKQRDDSELTKENQFMGTLSYASPEQLMGERGKVTPLTDIYGLGIVMYELATMSHPIQAEDPAAIVAAITQGKIRPPRELNPHISAEFEAIIFKCLAKDPRQRYGDADKLARDLQQKEPQQNWFSGFKDMLKGWFFKEANFYEPPQNFSLQPASDSPATAALRFQAAARKKFFVNFAVMEAIEDLRQAYEINPASSDTLFLMCFALNAIGEGSEIKRLLEISASRIIETGAKDSGKFELTREIFLYRDYEEGRKQAIRLQQIYPDDYDFYLAQFFCLETLGNYTEAIKVGEALSLRAEENNIIAVAQSECYFSIMEFDKAITVLRKRIELHPDFHNLHLKIIQALLLSGKYDEALHEAELVLNKDPMNMLMQFYYGRILASKNELQKAYGAFRQAVGLPGDESLRAMSYYALYRVMEMQGKSEAGKKHLKQARKIKPQMAFMTLQELQNVIDAELLPGIMDEIGNEPWLATMRNYARKICADSINIRSYTIGNYGCTSILVIREDGTFKHHNIFSNFNIYDYEELYTQLWLPELPKSPFIDENGNILTSVFYRIDGAIGGGIASITLAEPWKSGRSSHIYCRLADGKLVSDGKTRKFILPRLPQPACRRQAFLIVLPASFESRAFSKQPDETVSYEQNKVMCFFPYLTAGEVFELEFVV